MARDASASIERLVERSFPVTQKASVQVDTFYGGIQVRTTDRAEVKVTIRQSIDASSEEAADRQLRAIEISFENQADGMIRVRARYKKAARWTWEKWPPVGLAIELSVPTACDLNLISREGGITVGNLRGEVKVRALQGPIFVGETDGSVTAWSERGDIAVTACTGPLTIHTRSGNVLVGRASGPTEITGLGAVEVQSAVGPLRAEADGSDLKIGFAAPLRGNCEVRAAKGNVTASFDPQIDATLEVRASAFEKITSRDLSIKLTQGEVGHSRLQGALNRGGPRVSVRASGSVRLLGVPSMPGER